jgi:histidinol-phosphate phosphatase family protein
MPAVFLDRDGTLMEDTGYPSDPGQVRVLPGVPAGLRRLRAAGYRLVLATNQSGIARGLLSEDGFSRVTAALERASGCLFDGVYHCPHGPDSKCSCRKPAPGMLLAAARDLDLDLARSFSVGDRGRDAEAGRAAGARSVLLGAGPAPGGVLLAADFPAAVELILREGA